jgi:hypothetical protein
VISKNESPRVDREALAEQVIISAGNVLAAAGFTRAEIGDFFRQAAEQLQASATEVMPRSDKRLAHVATEFSRHPAVHELHGLAAKANALLPLKPEGDDLREAFDLAMKAAPLLAEAQQALRALAVDASLPLVPNRAERERQATSGEEPGDALILCLEDFEALYLDAVDLVGAVAHALAAGQDSEAFTFLLAHLADNAVILNPRLQAVFEEGARSLG